MIKCEVCCLEYNEFDCGLNNINGALFIGFLLTHGHEMECVHKKYLMCREIAFLIKKSKNVSYSNK